MVIPYRAVGMLPKPINCAKIVIRKLPRVALRRLVQRGTSGRKGDSLPALPRPTTTWGPNSLANFLSTGYAHPFKRPYLTDCGRFSDPWTTHIDSVMLAKGPKPNQLRAV
jgi:hypothetical protein